jgi:hypothetical protein
VRLLDAQLAREPGADRRYQPRAGAGADNNGADFVGADLGVR